MNLNGLKYAELQKLAKEAGIKANIKSDRLKKALEEYYAAQNKYSGEKQNKNATNARSSDAQKKGGRKRRHTYELEDDEVTIKNQPTSTGRDSGSCGTRELIASMDTTKSDEEMKQSLMDALDERVKKCAKVEVKATTIGSISNVTAANTTKIPRFTKPTVTPGRKNWTKIHQRNDKASDSIDVYMEKKRKRADFLLNKSHDANLSLNNTITKVNAAIEKQKSYKTPEVIRVNRQTHAKSKLFSPEPVFKPTVLSTKDINMNFTTTKSPSVFKFNAGPSKIAKPVIARRKSPRSNATENNITVRFGKDVGGDRRKTGFVKDVGVRKSVAVGRKSVIVFTPKPETKSAKKFNLKESLARPLKYTPYTGKLKAMESRDTIVQNTISERQSKAVHTQSTKARIQANKLNIKTPPLKNSKDIRRKEAAKSRADKQFEARMKNRGIS